MSKSQFNNEEECIERRYIFSSILDQRCSTFDIEFSDEFDDLIRRHFSDVSDIEDEDFFFTMSSYHSVKEFDDTTERYTKTRLLNHGIKSSKSIKIFPLSSYSRYIRNYIQNE